MYEYNIIIINEKGKNKNKLYTTYLNLIRIFIQLINIIDFKSSLLLFIYTVSLYIHVLLICPAFLNCLVL